MTYDWEKDFKYGVDAEIAFAKIYKQKTGRELIHINEKNKPDFSFGDSFIELKTERYTKNIFFEIKNNNDFKPTGPFKAREQNATFIVWHPKQKLNNLYVFETDKLCDWLLAHDYPTIDVNNAHGYLVNKQFAIYLTFCKIFTYNMEEV